MPSTYKVLGQVNPTANTLTTVYTVPAATQTVISTVTVCNQANTATTFSLAVRPAGESIAAKHYVNFQTPLPANDTVAVTLGLTLGNTDVLSANVGSSSVSVNAYGGEIS